MPAEFNTAPKLPLSFKANTIRKSMAPLIRSGALYMTPKQVPFCVNCIKRWGFAVGGLITMSAHRYPDRLALVDDQGELTYSELRDQAWVVASQAAMLALSSAQVGDVAVRTDINKSFILKADGYSTLSNWQELLTPSDKVQSVNGKTGAVTIGCSDIGAATTTQLSNHASSDIHLTTTQKTKIADSKNYLIISGASKAVATSTSSTDITNNCIIGGLKLYTKIDTSYIQPVVNAYLGIDKTKVLTPSSTIDGGTY